MVFAMILIKGIVMTIKKQINKKLTGCEYEIIILFFKNHPWHYP